MKNKLLITTALVALVTASNAYAEALNIANGDNITIEADQWDDTFQKTNNIYDSISMTGGSLTGTPDIDGSLTVAGDAEFSGGNVNRQVIMMTKMKIMRNIQIFQQLVKLQSVVIRRLLILNKLIFQPTMVLKYLAVKLQWVKMLAWLVLPKSLVVKLMQPM